MKLPLTILGVSELIIWILSQIDVIPDQLFNIFMQLPVVGLFAWYVLYSNKQTREWLDHLLKTQDERHQRTIELFENIFDRMDTRQGQMADRIELITQQLAINTATVNEIAKVDSIVSELIGRLEKK